MRLELAGIFDIVSTITLLGTAGVLIYAVIFGRANGMRGPALFLAATALLLAAIATGNATDALGFSTASQALEGYLEILIMPLLVYAMYGLYSRCRAVQAERQHAVANRLGSRLTDSLAQLDEHRLGMLQALSAAVDARDHYTALHSIHVADYACAIAYRLGMRRDLTALEQAGLLHDIGKIGVPDEILLKPAQLSDAEYSAIMRHSQESAHIIEAIPFLSDVVPMVRHHHERWDGSGYPDGLAGEDIPAEARVLAVADAFDAMTTDRPYRAALPVETARELLLDARGKQFDPAVVDALLTLLDEGIVVVDTNPAAA